MLNSAEYPSRPAGGFTIIEVLIVVSVLGVMLALGVPAMSTFIGNSSIRTNAEAIANGIQFARTEAIRRNAGVTFVLNPGGATYTVNLASDSSVLNQRGAEARADAVVVTPSPAGATTLTYTSLGTLSANADASAAITAVKVNANTANAAQLRNMCVLVSVGGVARMCDPLRVDPTDPQRCQPAVDTDCVPIP